MKGVNDVLQDFEQIFPMGNKSGAVNILKNDHQKVKRLFAQWETAKGTSKKQELLDQIIKELSVHESVEEDLIYPIIEDSQRQKVKDKAEEGLEEQHLLRIELSELADTKADARTIKAKMSVLKENVLRHAEEEEKVIFPAVKNSGVDLERLGQQILKRKQQLMSDVARGGGVGKNKDRNALLTTAKRKPLSSGSAAAQRESSLKQSKTDNVASMGERRQSKAKSSTKGSTNKSKSARSALSAKGGRKNNVVTSSKQSGSRGKAKTRKSA